MRRSGQENSTYTTEYETRDRRNFGNYFARIEHAGFGTFYRNLLGSDLLYGGASFSSLRANDSGWSGGTAAGLMRKNRYTIQRPTRTCPHCGFEHHAADIVRIDDERLRCQPFVAANARSQ
jgi:hypothetical protein